MNYVFCFNSHSAMQLLINSSMNQCFQKLLTILYAPICDYPIWEALLRPLGGGLWFCFSLFVMFFGMVFFSFLFFCFPHQRNSNYKLSRNLDVENSAYRIQLNPFPSVLQRGWKAVLKCIDDFSMLQNGREGHLSLQLYNNFHEIFNACLMIYSSLHNAIWKSDFVNYLHCAADVFSLQVLSSSSCFCLLPGETLKGRSCQ